jgi:hypothetical protein
VQEFFSLNFFNALFPGDLLDQKIIIFKDIYLAPQSIAVPALEDYK